MLSDLDFMVVCFWVHLWYLTMYIISISFFNLCMCSESAHYMCHAVLWDASSPRVTPVWLTGHCDTLTDLLSDCECDVSGWFSNH